MKLLFVGELTEKMIKNIWSIMNMNHQLKLVVVSSMNHLDSAEAFFFSVS